MGEPPKLLERVSAALRVRHYSRRTEESYLGWIRRFILFHNKRHPAAMGADEVNAFLTSLAVDSHVAAATQNQEILFLYRVVLDDPLPWLTDIVRARRSERLPVVLTWSEARAVIDQMEGVSRLVVQLLYGSGVRLLECLRLRVKDVDFARHEVFVRDPKGRRDRVTPLPHAVDVELHAHFESVRRVHDADVRLGFGSVARRTRSAASFRMRIAIGYGSGCSLRRVATSMRRRERSGDITSMNRRCSVLCMRPQRSRVCRNG